MNVLTQRRVELKDVVQKSQDSKSISKCCFILLFEYI